MNKFNKTMNNMSFLVLMCVFIIFAYTYGKHNGYNKGVSEGYDIGSWATVLHHKCFGNYGSTDYHENIKRGRLIPQNRQDIERLINNN